MQLRGRDILWQKERLLNVALASLPAHCTKVAWLNSDIVFENGDWVKKAQRGLDKVPLLQPFSHAHYLPEDIVSGPFKAAGRLHTRFDCARRYRGPSPFDLVEEPAFAGTCGRPCLGRASCAA